MIIPDEYLELNLLILLNPILQKKMNKIKNANANFHFVFTCGDRRNSRIPSSPKIVVYSSIPFGMILSAVSIIGSPRMAQKNARNGLC